MENETFKRFLFKPENNSIDWSTEEFIIPGVIDKPNKPNKPNKPYKIDKSYKPNKIYEITMYIDISRLQQFVNLKTKPVYKFEYITTTHKSLKSFCVINICQYKNNRTLKSPEKRTFRELN